MAVDQNAWFDRVRSVWNERSASWDEMSEANAVAPDRVTELDRVLSALSIKPGDKLLDAGCGTGQYALAFAERGLKVTAIDLAPDMIARAKTHAAERNLHLTFRVESVDAISDPLAIYDAIHARVVLQFVPSIPAALAELRRVLKPGGRMRVSVPGALSPIYNRSWRRYIEPEAMGANFVVPWELEEILMSLRWNVLDQWGELGESLTGETNAVTQEEFAQLPRRLQQAAATTWTFIVR